MRKFSALLAVSFIVVLFFSGSACSAMKKGSSAEGKIVDVNGNPIAGVKVMATQNDPIKGYEKIETKSKNDGTFVIKGLYPESSYYISFEGGQCNGGATRVYSPKSGETKIIQPNIELRFSPFKKKGDDIVFDSRTGLEWAISSKEFMNWYKAKEYIEGLSLAGGGWRLPTKSELVSLYETGEIGCGCGEILNLTKGSTDVWSSEWAVNVPFPGDFAWIIDPTRVIPLQYEKNLQYKTAVLGVRVSK